MRFCVVVLLAILSSWLLAEEVIVLTNGKMIIVPDTFEVKGNYVVYAAEDGEVMQLPVKVVDLEKSRAATLQYQAELEAQRAAEAAASAEQPEEPPRSIADLAEQVENRRAQDGEVVRDVVITSDVVAEFGQDHPAPEFQQASVDRLSPDLSAEDVERARNAFQESYNGVQQELEAIDQRIQTAEAEYNTLQNHNNFGDDPTSATWDSMQSVAARLKELRELRAEKEKELDRIRGEARNHGIKDTRRNYKYQKRRDASGGEEPGTEPEQVEYNPEDDTNYQPD